MPVFAPASLDARGNPVDGYEVEDNQPIGRRGDNDIYLPPDLTERGVVEALIEARLVQPGALKMFEDKELVVELGGQDIELLEREVAWAHGDDMYLDMKGRRTPTAAVVARQHELEEDEIEEVEGFCPVMLLSELYDEEPDWKKFDFETFWKAADDQFAMIRVVEDQIQALVIWSDEGIAEYSFNQWVEVVNDADHPERRGHGTFLANHTAELSAALGEWLQQNPRVAVWVDQWYLEHAKVRKKQLSRR